MVRSTYEKLKSIYIYIYIYIYTYTYIYIYIYIHIYRERERGREGEREQSSPLQDQKEGRLFTHITLKFLMSWSLFTLQQRYRIPLNSLPHGPTGNNPFDCLFPFSSWRHPPQTLASAPGWISGLWICCPVISWSQSLASP